MLISTGACRRDPFQQAQIVPNKPSRTNQFNSMIWLINKHKTSANIKSTHLFDNTFSIKSLYGRLGPLLINLSCVWRGTLLWHEPPLCEYIASTNERYRSVKWLALLHYITPSLASIVLSQASLVTSPSVWAHPGPDLSTLRGNRFTA